MITHSNKLKTSLTTVLLMLFSQCVFAQAEQPILSDNLDYKNHQEESILDHLMESGMSKLEIEAPIDDLFNDRRYKNYKQAIATFIFKNGETWTDSLEVKVRGVYRAAKCDNPPLKIKYSKKLLEERGLKKRNEYKLVYPCKNTEEYQNYIYKEYLIYKLYNELTDKSLRVHLIDFTIRDSEQTLENINSTGFMIEHREEIIKRLDAYKNDERCLSIPIKNVASHEYMLFQVFQYMIGNVDWIVENCKNAEVILMQDSTIVPIPYDFDYTGMVNPSYARPDARYKQKKITDRYFLGDERNLEELSPIFELFKEKESSFKKIINDFEYLPKKERKAMLYYLKTFYRLLNSSDEVKEAFIQNIEAK